MIHVNLGDGTVVTFDLASERGRSEWREASARDDFQRSIRGVSLSYGKYRSDLPLPRRFREVAFEADFVENSNGTPIAEYISVIADGIVLTLTLFLDGRAGRFRVDLDRRGKPRYRPAYR